MLNLGLMNIIMLNRGLMNSFEEREIKVQQLHLAVRLSFDGKVGVKNNGWRVFESPLNIKGSI